MKKIFFFFLAFIFLALSLALPVFAHPGKTDANGGHYDHETGEYHYHHGYPAHQHYGGVCPYDYDDKTGSDARPSTGSASTESSSSLSATFFDENSDRGLGTVGIIVTIIIFVVLCGILFWLWAF